MGDKNVSHHLPLAVTCGEPAGIGPELCLQIMPPSDVPLVFVADPDMLRARAQQLGIQAEIIEWDGQPFESDHRLRVWPVRLAEPAVPGQLNKANAGYVLETLDVAIDGCLDGRFAGMVTAPVHKGIINEAGVPFSGHTEYLQERCGVEKVVMMLATEGLRVALATTHLPLKDVAQAITPTLLTQVIQILHDALKQYWSPSPNILVAGLNPHAGEGGHMGREEIETIIPVLETLRQQHHMRLEGPLPADTLFTPHHLVGADAVLAMYHDQGLPVLKYKGFGAAVNITLGLPIIRTSVDHGTALDLAGTGQADAGSLLTAIRYAREMALGRAKHA